MALQSKNRVALLQGVVDYLSYLNASSFEYLHYFTSLIGIQNYHLIASFEQNPSLYKNTPSFYNKQVYIRPFPSSASPLISGSVLDLDKIEVFGSLGLGRKPGTRVDLGAAVSVYEAESIIVVDNLLKPEAIRELHNWMLESTIWHVSDKSRYVGAYWEEGFYHPILLKLANELEEQFSFIKGQALTQIWAYNFDNMDDVEWERKSSSNNSVGRDVSKRGIGLHCDFARVNINI